MPVQMAYPMDDGEVLFSKDFTENPTIPVFGSGDFVIVEHPDSIRAYYFHLQSGTIKPDLGHVDTETKLGIIGNSGHSAGAHLHFTVEDYKNKKIINQTNR